MYQTTYQTPLQFRGVCPSSTYHIWHASCQTLLHFRRDCCSKEASWVRFGISITMHLIFHMQSTIVCDRLYVGIDTPKTSTEQVLKLSL